MGGERDIYLGATFMFDNIIFDLDGTLVDSDKIVLKALGTWANMHNLDIAEIKSLCIGRRIEDTVQLIAPHLDVVAEKEFIENLESSLVEEASPIEGAKEFISKLASQSWSIVTSSTRKSCVEKLQHCGLTQPSLIVSADDTDLGKPNPEPYLTALKLLRKDSHDSLVFEDSEDGIKSALAANCKVVVIGDNSSVDHRNIVFRARNFLDDSLSVFIAKNSSVI